MRPTKLFFIETRDGHVVLAADPGFARSRRPVVVLIHGAFRVASDLAAWLDRLDDLPADIVLACLPGHGNGPPLARAGMAAMIENFQDALAVIAPRGVTILGESLGGLIGLAQAYPCVAFEPPLATAKLWPIWTGLRLAQTQGLAVPAGFAEAVFGAPENGHDYSGLLDRSSAPGLVVLGDVPLQPPRDLTTTPSLLDDADRKALAARPRLRVEVLAGGHELLKEAPDDCERLIRDFLDA